MGRNALLSRCKRAYHGIRAAKVSAPWSSHSEQALAVLILSSEPDDAETCANIARRTRRRICPKKAWSRCDACPFAHRVKQRPEAAFLLRPPPVATIHRNCWARRSAAL